MSPTRVAFTVWEGRISPVFDAAQQVLVFDVREGQAVASRQEALSDAQPLQKVAAIQGMGVQVLVCGAISVPVAAMVRATGIRLIPYIAGSVGDVLRAFLTGNLSTPSLQMPGCCGGQRQFRGERGPYAATNRPGEGWGGTASSPGSTMPLGNGTGGRGGGGRGRGTGRGRRGRWRMQNPDLSSPGECVCPSCGHRQAHERAQPCVQLICPNCGTTMTRG